MLQQTMQKYKGLSETIMDNYMYRLFAEYICHHDYGVALPKTFVDLKCIQYSDVVLCGGYVWENLSMCPLGPNFSPYVWRAGASTLLTILGSALSEEFRATPLTGH